MDNSLILEFVSETKENLADLGSSIVEFEKNPNNKDLLNGIFRVMHTIKGTCGFIGLMRLERLAHTAENLVQVIRDDSKTVSPEIVTIILRALDQIKEILIYLEEHSKEPEGSDDELIDQINKMADNFSNNIASAPDNNPVEQVLEPVQQQVKTSEPNLIQDSIPASEVAPVAQDIKENLPATGISENQPQEHHPEEQNPKENNQTALDPNKKAANNYVRINVNLLEELMQSISELVLNRNQLLRLNKNLENNDFSNLIQKLDFITTEIQDRVVQTRMQPIKIAWVSLPRIIRDISNTLNKKIDLIMEGEDTELDRQLIEIIKDPLMHIVRNAADHGIEVPEERIKNGKSEKGTIKLKAYHQAGYINIEISDDGRGLRKDKIKNKIIEKNYATKEEVEQMTQDQIIQYIFKAGFSTAEKVTAISGRGVGMDVVKNNISKISGTIDIKSIEGKGSSFNIKLPLTLAIMSILIFDVNNLKFGIPQINVQEIIKMSNQLESLEKIKDKAIMRLRDKLVPIIRLDEMLGLKKYSEDTILDDIDSKYNIICEVNNNIVGILVDRIYDTEEIVLKPLPPILKKVGIYGGNTILGSGEVILTLDPGGVIIKNSTSENLLKTDENEKKNMSSNEDDMQFLMLKDTSNQIKAIPLELVNRLEEIKIEKIEFSQGRMAVQYRGNLMYIKTADGSEINMKANKFKIVVFYNGVKYFGLIVNDIIDIVTEKKSDHDINANKDMSSVVINGKITDIVKLEDICDFDESEIIKSEPNELKKKILMVDDSPFFRKFLPPTLEKNNFEVVSVASAQKATELLEKDHNFSLILTDLKMPGISGADFAKSCRNSEELKQIPIIGLIASEENIQEHQLDIFDLVVSKTNYREIINGVHELAR